MAFYRWIRKADILFHKLGLVLPAVYFDNIGIERPGKPALDQIQQHQPVFGVYSPPESLLILVIEAVYDRQVRSEYPKPHLWPARVLAGAGFSESQPDRPGRLFAGSEAGQRDLKLPSVTTPGRGCEPGTFMIGETTLHRFVDLGRELENVRQQ